MTGPIPRHRVCYTARYKVDQPMACIRFEYGLSSIPKSREESMLDPETLWRIAPDMNVVAVPPPVRNLNKPAIAILEARRAGNRGKSAGLLKRGASLQRNAKFSRVFDH